jgi:NADPH:quinone reductase-like Zn-dependent oxidoreductase
MKAAVRSKYGIPGDLTIKELEIPTPKEDEVLIKVHATTVNRTDCHVLSGKPFFMRLFTGLFKPKLSIIGSDFAGQVEAVGSSVKSFKAGDRIMGFGGVMGCGSHAQYFTLSERNAIEAMIMMPANITYEAAAACLEGAFYAGSGILQLKPKAGTKAMVYGATGAIGTAYVQFFKYYGVYVTAVCGRENNALIRSLGADRIIDYKTEDFTKDTERYDYVFDAVGKSNFTQCKPLLKKDGLFNSSAGLVNIILAIITPIFGGKKVIFRPPKDVKGTLSFIRDLYEKGRFKPVIDRKYPLDKIAEAFTYVASGQKIGNVVITMDA